MQLDQRSPGPRWLPGLALLLLIAGGEIYLRFSVVSIGKALGLIALVAGVLVLGWPSSGLRMLTYKATVSLVFVAYVVQAAWRFRGVLKSPQPYASVEVGLFGLKVLFVLVALTVASGGIVRLARLCLRQWQLPRRSPGSGGR